MCYVPGATELAVASLVGTVGSSVMGFMGESQAASDQNAYHNANANNSIIAFQNDIEANNLDHMAAQEDTAQAELMARREGFIASSAALAEAGSRGVGGLSSAAIRHALGFQAGENVSYIQRNAELNEERARLGMRAAQDTAKSRINSAPKARAPSPISLGLKMAGGVVSAYGMYSGMKADERSANRVVDNAAAAIKR